MVHHFHAYVWTGSGGELAYEDERRTGSPEFTTSPLPPIRTGDWLAKPRSRVAATLHAVDEAVSWMAAEYERAAPYFLHLEQERRIGLPLRLENAAEQLAGGVDAQWGFWLRDGRFTTIGMICCPNRHAAHRCPVRR